MKAIMLGDKIFMLQKVPRNNTLKSQCSVVWPRKWKWKENCWGNFSIYFPSLFLKTHACNFLCHHQKVCDGNWKKKTKRIKWIEMKWQQKTRMFLCGKVSWIFCLIPVSLYELKSGCEKINCSTQKSSNNKKEFPFNFLASRFWNLWIN
jgi:hypothetical protein